MDIDTAISVGNVFACAFWLFHADWLLINFYCVSWIIFNNDAWLFNPLTDPIINALPEAYFMHCFILFLFY